MGTAVVSSSRSPRKLDAPSGLLSTNIAGCPSIRAKGTRQMDVETEFRSKRQYPL